MWYFGCMVHSFTAMHELCVCVYVCVILNLPFCVCMAGMEKKVREDAVYITLLPDEVTAEKIGELFGSIGRIKVRVCVSVQR